jgi:hypothetical protein
MSRIDQFFKKISSLRYAADQEDEFIKSREKEVKRKVEAEEALHKRHRKDEIY